MKAGCPVVSARQGFVPSGVIAEEAFAVGAPLSVLTPRDIAEAPEARALIGQHQAENAALAAKALTVWGDARITPNAIQRGAAEVVWPGRMQKLGQGPIRDQANDKEVWLDGGHNPHAAKAIAAHFEALPGRTVLVTAMMAAKDAGGFFRAFAGLETHVFTCPNASGHNGANPDALAVTAEEAGVSAEHFSSFDAAFAAACAAQAERILICGSLYMAGDILARNNELPV